MMNAKVKCTNYYVSGSSVSLTFIVNISDCDDTDSDEELKDEEQEVNQSGWELYLMHEGEIKITRHLSANLRLIRWVFKNWRNITDWLQKMLI